MAGHYIRKRVRSAGWALWLAGFSGLLLCTAILVYRLGGIDFAALKALFLVVFCLVCLALAIALYGLARVWHSGPAGGAKAVGALAIALVVGLPYLGGAILAVEYPQANSAETDGMMLADFADGIPVPDAMPEQDTSSATGRRFQARAAQVYSVTRNVLDDAGWQLVDVTTGGEQEGAPPADLDLPDDSGDLGVSGTIAVPLPTPRSVGVTPVDPFAKPDSDDYLVKAVAWSPLLALPSDVTIRIVEDGNETFVDLRSTSRSVAWDLGQNRRFIEDFLARLDTAMAAVSVVLPAAGES